MSEKKLCDSIVEMLNYQGCYVWRNNSGKVMVGRGSYKRMIYLSPTGSPDIIGMTKEGKFIGIEVKLPKTRNKVTLVQREFLELIKIKGGISGVATSVEEALEILNDTN